ncbi:MAG: O-antigen polymerase [Candidatus Hodarchaeota archaeon]
MFSILNPGWKRVKLEFFGIFIVVMNKEHRDIAFPRHFTKHYLWLATACLVGASLVIFAWYIAASKFVDWTAFFLVCLHIGLCAILIRFESRKGSLDIFHPVIFYCIIFVFPMIIIKGTLLAFGMESRFLSLTPDSYHYLDLSLICTFVGTIGLILGFRFQFGRSLAARLPLPQVLSIPLKLRWQPLVVTYVIGLIFALYLCYLGIFGASLSEFEGDLTWVQWLQRFSQWYLMSLFLLVFYITRRQNKKLGWLIATGLALASSIILAFLSGNRSGLLWILILCIGAVQYARYPRIRLRELAPWLVGACIALVLGIMIISLYRTSRQTEWGYDTISVHEITMLMHESTKNILFWKVTDLSDYTANRIVERINAVEKLGVTLAFANDEGVRASERSVGINNNIIKNLFCDFVPRAIWPNKPAIGNFGLYFSQIYLDSRYRTWTGPSIFGDLYRNFGILGIPLGMFVLGIFLRIIYERLIVMGNGNALAVLVYYFLLIGVNYEGTYHFLGGWLRTIFIFLPLLWIVTRGQRPYQLLANRGHLSA